jgi:hypothetical protein
LLTNLGCPRLIHRSWCSGFVPPFALGAMKDLGIGNTEFLPLFMEMLAQADV